MKTSKPDTMSRVPSLRMSLTRLRPIGFGLVGDSIANTPIHGNSSALRPALRNRFGLTFSGPICSGRQLVQIAQNKDVREPIKAIKRILKFGENLHGRFQFLISFLNLIVGTVCSYHSHLSKNKVDSRFAWRLLNSLIHSLC